MNTKNKQYIKEQLLYVYVCVCVCVCVHMCMYVGETGFEKT